MAELRACDHRRPAKKNAPRKLVAGERIENGHVAKGPFGRINDPAGVAHDEEEDRVHGGTAKNDPMKGFAQLPRGWGRARASGTGREEACWRGACGAPSAARTRMATWLIGATVKGRNSGGVTPGAKVRRSPKGCQYIASVFEGRRLGGFT